MGYKIIRKKCDTCNSTCGHVVSGNCGYEFHNPCKKHPGHNTQSSCPSCRKSTG